MADPTIQISSPQPNTTIGTAVAVLGSYALTEADPPTITCWFVPDQGPNVDGVVTVDDAGLTWSAAFGDTAMTTLPAGSTGRLWAQLGPDGPTHSVPVSTSNTPLVTLTPPPPLTSEGSLNRGKSFVLTGTFLAGNPVCYLRGKKVFAIVGIMTASNGQWSANFFHLPRLKDVTIHVELWSEAGGLLARLERRWNVK